MEPDKDPTPDAEVPSTEQTPEVPADALSRTPDELEQEQAQQAAEAPATETSSDEKKPSSFRRILRQINVYLLVFILLIVVTGVIAVVNYLNSQEGDPVESIASQELTPEELRQLANTDTTVGDISQTLTIQGSAIIDGQTLMRGDLNVAGNFQAGGDIQGASLTIAGSSNLSDVQIDSLQVAGNTAVQGDTTLRNLTVSGTSSFSSPMTASQITVSRLILSGNAVLEVPNHISFTGPSPSRTINAGVLGSGGSASVNGSDTAGTVNVNTGGNPSAGCFVRVVFNQASPSQPRVTVTPIGNAAGRTQHYVERDTTGFSICSAIPAPSGQAFAFDYFVTN